MCHVVIFISFNVCCVVDVMSLTNCIDVLCLMLCGEANLSNSLGMWCCTPMFLSEFHLVPPAMFNLLSCCYCCIIFRLYA